MEMPRTKKLTLSGLCVVAARRARVGPSRPRPLFLSRVPAGFPSPADDYMEKRLDINEALVNDEEATFFVRVAGDSMTGAGIHDGDILVVDRSAQPTEGDVVIAILDGELTVKRYEVRSGKPYLMPEARGACPNSSAAGARTTRVGRRAARDSRSVVAPSVL